MTWLLVRLILYLSLIVSSVWFLFGFGWFFGGIIYANNLAMCVSNIIVIDMYIYIDNNNNNNIHEYIYVDT